MKFSASIKSETTAYFSFHGVHSSWVRRSGEPRIQGHASGSDITPTHPGRLSGCRGLNEERKLAVPCLLSALHSDTQLWRSRAAILPEALSYFRLGHTGQSQACTWKAYKGFSSGCFRNRFLLEVNFLHFPLSTHHFGNEFVLGGQMHGW